MVNFVGFSHRCPAVLCSLYDTGILQNWRPRGGTSPRMLTRSSAAAVAASSRYEALRGVIRVTAGCGVKILRSILRTGHVTAVAVCVSFVRPSLFRSSLPSPIPSSPRSLPVSVLVSHSPSLHNVDHLPLAPLLRRLTLSSRSSARATARLRRTFPPSRGTPRWALRGFQHRIHTLGYPGDIVLRLANVLAPCRVITLVKVV